MFEGDSQLCSEFAPGTRFRDHSWCSSGNHQDVRDRILVSGMHSYFPTIIMALNIWQLNILCPVLCVCLCVWVCGWSFSWTLDNCNNKINSMNWKRDITKNNLNRVEFHLVKQVLKASNWDDTRLFFCHIYTYLTSSETASSN